MVRYVAWMCMVLAATVTQAQEAQRLQYRTDGQPERVIGVYAEVRVRAETSPPAGLAVPKFAGTRPLFAKWITPRVPAGHLWLALDQSAKQGAYDRLYADTNADGSLADETPVAAEQAAAANDPDAPVSYGRKLNQQTARFAAVKIIFPGKDGPVAYHLNVTFRSRVQRVITWTQGVPDREVLVEELWLTPGGWHEGTVTVGGKTYTCWRACEEGRFFAKHPR